MQGGVMGAKAFSYVNQLILMCSLTVGCGRAGLELQPPTTAQPPTTSQRPATQPDAASSDHGLCTNTAHAISSLPGFPNGLVLAGGSLFYTADVSGAATTRWLSTTDPSAATRLFAATA